MTVAPSLKSPVKIKDKSLCQWHVGPADPFDQSMLTGQPLTVPAESAPRGPLSCTLGSLELGKKVFCFYFEIK